MASDMNIHPQRQAMMESSGLASITTTPPLVLVDVQSLNNSRNLAKSKKQQTLQGAISKIRAHPGLKSLPTMAKSSKASIIEAVESVIQYQFKNTELLWEALHSRGVNHGESSRVVPEDGNLRLAIVGDAVLKTLSGRRLVCRWNEDQRYDSVIAGERIDQNTDSNPRAFQ